MFREYNFFWTTMELCDWDQEGDDDKVLKPVIEYLSKQEDYIIFEFDDLMSELLYHLDTEKLAEQCKKVDSLTIKKSSKGTKKVCGIWNLNHCFMFQKKRGL